MAIRLQVNLIHRSKTVKDPLLFLVRGSFALHAKIKVIIRRKRFPHHFINHDEGFMLSDIEICRTTPLQPIDDVAHQAGLQTNEFQSQGRYKAKVSRRPKPPKRSP